MIKLSEIESLRMRGHELRELNSLLRSLRNEPVIHQISLAAQADGSGTRIYLSRSHFKAGEDDVALRALIVQRLQERYDALRSELNEVGVEVDDV